MSFSVIQENKQKFETKKFPPIDTVVETAFYTMSVYFPAAKVSKTRYTLTGTLLATLAGTVASVVLAGQLRDEEQQIFILSGVIYGQFLRYA